LVRRFLNEARAASAIRHRNIIEVFDAGVTPEGAPYILMEFLEGVSLQKRVADKGRLPLTQVLEIARQAGSALAAAHEAGIVHRDLKPENLFLVPDPTAPGGERVKILDFGIAKISSRSGTGGTMRTQTGLIMGSPAYMSPEQCKDSADVDLRSDIYSFAIIVYEMLTGRPPFVAASGTEMLVMHLTATPPPMRPLVADLPAPVEAAIMRGLARARDERFDSVASFVAALRGEAGRGSAVLNRSSSEEMQAVGQNPAGPTVVLEAATTFSRARAEVTATAGDEVVLASGRARRWPFFAASGAAVVAGVVVVFLLLRPSQEAASPLTSGPLKVAIPDLAVPAVATARPDAAAAVVLPSKTESPAEPPVAVEAQAARKPARAGGAPAGRRHAKLQPAMPTPNRAFPVPSESPINPLPRAPQRQDNPAGF
jgi:serine/threonine-protein kinase